MNPEDILIRQVFATEPPKSMEALIQTTSMQPAIIDFGSLTVLMVVWVLIICSITQFIKHSYLFANPGAYKKRRYRSVVLIIPLIVGAFTGLGFGPLVARALSFVINPALGIGVGFAAGMISTWAWDLSQRVFVPILLAIAPSAARQLLVKLLARVGIDVKTAAQMANIDLTGLEEQTLEEHSS